MSLGRFESFLVDRPLLPPLPIQRRYIHLVKDRFRYEQEDQFEIAREHCYLIETLQAIGAQEHTMLEIRFAANPWVCLPAKMFEQPQVFPEAMSLQMGQLLRVKIRGPLVHLVALAVVLD